MAGGPSECYSSRLPNVEACRSLSPHREPVVALTPMIGARLNLESRWGLGKRVTAATAARPAVVEPELDLAVGRTPRRPR